MPLLFGKDADKTIAYVLILPFNIGVGMMLVVMSLTPIVAGAENIPFKLLTIEVFISDKIILTVDHIMTQLHIVDNFR